MNNKKIFSLMVLGTMLAMNTSAQTLNGWRGPKHDGNYPDKGLLKEWPAEGPKQIFETVEAGKGYSSPVVANGKVYVTGMNEDQTREIFSCFTLDGKKVYSTEYGKPWGQSFPETRTTPAISKDRAYVISGSGEIVCLNLADGKTVWSVNGVETYGQKYGNWGTSECPLVYDNKVIYTPCGDKTTMVALDKDSGKEIWKTASLGDKSGYVSPILITYKGKRQIITSSASHAFGVNPDNGEIEWTFDDFGPKFYGKGDPTGNITTNSAVYQDGRIFFCHGYNIDGFQLQLADDLKSVTLTWRTNVLDTHHGGYVLTGGILYGTNWISNNDGNWCALDWKTGDTIYETKWEGGKGKGSIIAADGQLICYDERRGCVGLVPAGKEFKPVSEFRIAKGSGPHWAHPTIADGVLYIRHAEALYAYKLK